MNVQAGYSYRDARYQFLLAPVFEYYAWGNDAFYGAWGVHSEWSALLSAASLFRLEGDYKQLRFRSEQYAASYNGAQRSLDATRRDNELNYTLTLRAPRWKMAGFTPSLSWQHNQVRSNVDWLYNYDRNDLSLKLEYSF